MSPIGAAFAEALAVSIVPLLAMQSMLRVLSPLHGRLLICVWAVEQEVGSKRCIPCLAAAGDLDDDIVRPTDKTDGRALVKAQDVFVPWVRTLQKPTVTTVSIEDAAIYAANDSPAVFQRYYHMFARGELKTLVYEAAEALGLAVDGGDADCQADKGGRGLRIVSEGWERSNWYLELQRW